MFYFLIEKVDNIFMRSQGQKTSATSLSSDYTKKASDKKKITTLMNNFLQKDADING